MLSSDLREELSQRFCVKERLGRCSLYFAKLVMTTFEFDDHVVSEFVVADAPDHTAARHLNALQGFRPGRQRALDASAARISGEQPVEDFTYARRWSGASRKILTSARPAAARQAVEMICLVA
jgi:hypothetical protein